MDQDNPQNSTSVMWKAINATDGSLVIPESWPNDTSLNCPETQINTVATVATAITATTAQQFTVEAADQPMATSAE